MKQLSSLAASILLLCVVVTTFGCTRPTGNDPATQEIQACYTAMDQALVKKDVEAFAKPLAKELTFQPLKGPALDQVRYKQTASELIRAANNIQCTSRVIECTVKDGQAAVVAESKFKGDIEDPKGTKKVMESTTTTRDTWRKSEAGWQMVSSVETGRNTMQDGTPIPASPSK